MDYLKLAEQYGGTTTKDYSSLAKQFGGDTSSTERNYSLGELPGAMISNLPSDTKHLFSSLYGMGKQVVTHPIDSAKGLAKGFAKSVVGAVMPTPAGAPTTEEEMIQYDEPKQPDTVAGEGRQINEALLQLVEKYGLNTTTASGIEKELFDNEQFKRQLAEHPAEALFDASIILSGGGGAAAGTGKAVSEAGKVSKIAKATDVASKVAKTKLASGLTLDLSKASMAEKAGKLLEQGGKTAFTVGRNLDPITAPLKVGKFVAGKGINLASEALGVTTGMGSKAVKELYNTYAKGTAKEVSTATNLLKEDTGVAMTGVLGKVKEAMYSLKRKKGIEYGSALEKINKKIGDTKFVIDDIKKQAQQLMKDYNIKRDVEGKLDFSRSTISDEGIAQKILGTVFDWGKNSEDLTLKGLDILKQRLDDFYSPSSRKTNRMSVSLKNMVKGKLNKVTDGNYGKMTESYEKALNLEREIEKGLSLGNKTMADTAFRKLTSILRTNNEFRLQLLDVLEKELGVNLKSQLAAISGSELAPRGLMRTFAGGGGLAAIASGNLQFLAALVLTSPRLVAEFIKALGLSERAIKGLIDLIKVKSPELAAKLLKQIQETQPGMTIKDVSKKVKKETIQDLNLAEKDAIIDAIDKVGLDNLGLEFAERQKYFKILEKVEVDKATKADISKLRELANENKLLPENIEKLGKDIRAKKTTSITKAKADDYKIQHQITKGKSAFKYSPK